MGFYDLRCMVTGLSLRGIDATLVVLRRSGEAYQPITLGIAGSYNSYGGIDAVIEDVNTDLVLTHFLDRLRNGGFVIDTDHLNIEAQSPVTDIEDLLWCFERNCLCLVYDDEDPVATLDGALVTFALIAQPVWNALAAVAPSQGSVSEWFQGLFGDSSVAGQIYRERLDDVSEHLRELFAVSDFLATHGLTWAPPMEPSQRYPSFDYGMQHGSADMREFLVEAKRDYSDTVLRAAIELYEVEVDDMLRGEYDVVVGQSDGADAYRSGRSCT